MGYDDTPRHATRTRAPTSANHRDVNESVGTTALIPSVVPVVDVVGVRSRRRFTSGVGYIIHLYKGCDARDVTVEPRERDRPRDRTSAKEGA